MITISVYLEMKERTTQKVDTVYEMNIADTRKRKKNEI